MKRVLVPLAEGFEEIEAVTIVNILRRAGVSVTTAALGPDVAPVRGARGLAVVPDTPLDQVLDAPFDMVVLPGGMPGTTHLRQDKRLHRIITRIHGENGYTAAICAAPTVFADMGLLSGRTATGHPSMAAEMRPRVGAYSEERVVVDGRIVTSRGPGTAMEFAFTLVETLLGPAKAAEVNTGVMARL